MGDARGLTDKRVVLRKMRTVRALLMEEIRGNATHGRVAAGLSTEGFAGGYLAALDDIEAALSHGSPSDHRGYWRRAHALESARTRKDPTDV